MSHLRNPLRRRVLIAAALPAFAVASLAGCNTAEQIPPEELDAVNTGVNIEVGDLAAYNVLIISAAEGEPGRLLGVLMTSSKDPVDVTFADDNEQISVTLPADTGAEQQVFQFEENEHLFDTTDARPGALATITISTSTQSQEVQVPVYDGTLERYRPFLPQD